MLVSDYKKTEELIKAKKEWTFYLVTNSIWEEDRINCLIEKVVSLIPTEERTNYPEDDRDAAIMYFAICGESIKLDDIKFKESKEQNNVVNSEVKEESKNQQCRARGHAVKDNRDSWLDLMSNYIKNIIPSSTWDKLDGETDIEKVINFISSK